VNAMPDQRSIGWVQQRLGLCTASRFADVVAKKKDGKPTAERQKYLDQLVSERLTGLATPHFVTAAMNWGIENEAAAKVEFEWKTEMPVIETGFHQHPSILAGASPDGLIGRDAQTGGVLECKCPTSETHYRTLRDGMPEEHKAQIQGQLWITNRKFAYFVSYDPRFQDKKLQIYVERIERDDAYISALDAEVRKFLMEVEQSIAFVREKANG
jgi:YqaJ-like viral recombinase domain